MRSPMIGARIIIISLVTLAYGSVHAEDQASYKSPEEAVAAFAAAIKAKDENALRNIFGPRLNDIKNPDAIQAKQEFAVFSRRVEEGVKLERVDENTYSLEVGHREWPFPVPLVRKENIWYFDTAEGVEEVLNRRVGRNELQVIEIMRAFNSAQAAYASEDRDNDGVLEYAQRLRSTAQSRDGLYWESAESEPDSPFGEFMAKADSQGYGESSAAQPFYGYYFKLLKKQGTRAPGGAYDYVINGNMIGGFAVLAYPAEYGNSGVMTFVISHHGRLLQKDLGRDTEQVARNMDTFDPDDSWKDVTANEQVTTK